VDEFQDTDPIQRRILERAFLAAPCASGRAVWWRWSGIPNRPSTASAAATWPPDRRARARADGLHGLRQNFRSSKPLVRALNALMAPGLPLSQLPVPAVESCAEKGELLLDGGEQPLQLLPLDGDQLADRVAGLCLQLLQRDLKLRESQPAPQRRGGRSRG
jgi:exodeoxyribonuclease V beta subunit